MFNVWSFSDGFESSILVDAVNAEEAVVKWLKTNLTRTTTPAMVSVLEDDECELRYLRRGAALTLIGIHEFE